MRIILPRGLEVDLDNIPEDLEEQVQKCFAEYTKETNPKYMFHDKLLFIDVMIKKIHGNKDPEDAVMDAAINVDPAEDAGFVWGDLEAFVGFVIDAFDLAFECGVGDVFLDPFPPFAEGAFFLGFLGDDFRFHDVFVFVCHGFPSYLPPF